MSNKSALPRIIKNTTLGQFLCKPRITGAICPSSSGLGKMLCDEIELEKAKVVVELGPGTGAITKFIVERIAPDARFFSVELNKNVVSTFRKNFPKLKIYNDSASNLPNILKSEGIANADVIISGLPWAAFPDDLQEELLSAICEALPPNGMFTTFAYLQGRFLPAGCKFNKRLKQYFTTVKCSNIVWMNLPPAFVYRCQK